MVWTAVFVAVFFVLLYVYFMSQTVFDVAKRSAIENEIVKINSNISSLEFESISLRNNIGIKMAYSMGFVDVKGARYISKNPTTAFAKLNTVE